MKTNTKDNIWIEGFDEVTLGEQLHLFDDSTPTNVIYFGKTSKIPEELAKNMCNWMFWNETPEKRRYYNYNKRIAVSYPFLTAKESIQSACSQKYCIIYKTT